MIGQRGFRGREILLGGVLLVGLPACAMKNLSDWARVQAVPLGTKTKVQLYKDEAPAGNRNPQGRFHSVTGNSVTLKLEDGQTRIFQKETVLKVLTSRPPPKRGLFTMFLGVTTGMLLANAILEKGDLASVLVPLPVSSALFYIVESRMKDIYEAPPKRRSP